MALGKSTAVGGFVLGGLALGVAAILVFGGTRLFAKRLEAVVYFQDSVAGLAVGAPVTLRGVRIGSVRAMKVYLKLPDLTPVIPVYLDIAPGQVSWTRDRKGDGMGELELAIKAGLRAQLATQSLVTGQLAVNLDFHPDKPATVTNVDDGVQEIPAIPSDLEHIKNEIAGLDLPDLADKARVALNGITQVMGELNGRIGPIVATAQSTADAARVALETTTEAIRGLQRDANRTLADIDRLAVSGQGQLASVGKDTHQVLASVDRTMTQAEKVIGSLNDILAARSPIRGDLEAAVRDLAASASSLRNFSREVERNPSAILLGRPSR